MVCTYAECKHKSPSCVFKIWTCLSYQTAMFFHVFVIALCHIILTYKLIWHISLPWSLEEFIFSSGREQKLLSVLSWCCYWTQCFERVITKFILKSVSVLKHTNGTLIMSGLCQSCYAIGFWILMAFFSPFLKKLGFCCFYHGQDTTAGVPNKT